MLIMPGSTVYIRRALTVHITVNTHPLTSVKASNA